MLVLYETCIQIHENRKCNESLHKKNQRNMRWRNGQNAPRSINSLCHFFVFIIIYSKDDVFVALKLKMKMCSIINTKKKNIADMQMSMLKSSSTELDSPKFKTDK